MKTGSGCVGNHDFQKNGRVYRGPSTTVCPRSIYPSKWNARDKFICFRICHDFELTRMYFHGEYAKYTIMRTRIYRMIAYVYLYFVNENQ